MKKWMLVIVLAFLAAAGFGGELFGSIDPTADDAGIQFRASHLLASDFIARHKVLDVSIETLETLLAGGDADNDFISEGKVLEIILSEYAADLDTLSAFGLDDEDEAEVACCAAWQVSKYALGTTNGALAILME